MSQYNNKGMASDLSLGRPTASSGASDTDSIAAAAARHAYYMQQATRREQKEYRDDAQYESNIISGLESYMRALEGEREKLDAFRRELPICMGLLDDAIHASREKLTKAVSSARMVACQTSYSNYGNPGAEAANILSRGGHSTIWSREHEASVYSSLGMPAGSKPHIPHAHAHASDDDHQFQKHQLPPHFKEPLSIITPSHSMSMLPRPHFATSNPHLRLINYPPPPPPQPQPPYNTTSNNMFLNKLQQKEGTLFNQDSEMMRQQICRKAEGFQNTLEFSSSKNNEEEHINMRGREGNELYEGDGADERDEEAASPTELMISNMPNNSAAGGSQTPRKARRCWSPELHQRFLHALHQLGGPQSATPKQIREVMHVEGLTNDEVKSHLQKFRLHTRRPAPIQSSEPAQQPHHLVLFGGIWVPTSPAESAPAAQLTACHLAGGGHATSSGNHNAYAPFQHVIGQNPMQALMRAASSDGQLDVHGGLETASEVDVARSDQSTSQNGGLENNVHEDEDTEIHLGSKPILSRSEITSPIAKARYQ